MTLDYSDRADFDNANRGLVARLEPGVIDQKIYAPGLGIVSERSQKGPLEVAQLVSVTG